MKLTRPPSDATVRHRQQAVELRSQAQELKDAAGGEKASALGAKKEAAIHKDAYVVANASAKELQSEAAKLRAEAADKLRGSVGARGLHALENVARGFGKLMAKLSGQRLETTISIKSDPDAKIAAEKLLALAARKDEAAQAQLDIATNAHAQATAALAKMAGHEQTAANHLVMASSLLLKAKGHDATAVLAGAAHEAGVVVKRFFSELWSEVKTELQGSFDAHKGAIKGGVERAVQGAIKGDGAAIKDGVRDAVSRLLVAGGEALVKAAETKTTLNLKPTPAAHDAANDAAAVVKKDIEAKVATVTSFEPGKVSFGAPAGAAKAPELPNIDAPPKGEKKASESLVALRWAAEAAGIDWAGKGSGELKTALSSAKGGLHTKNGASPFEVKARLMERLGLPTGKDRANVHTLDLGVVREEFAKREALGMPRLSPRAELEAALQKLGLEKDTSSRMIAMTSLVKSSQDLEAAKDELKKDIKDEAKLAAFTKGAKALDESKQAMLDTIKRAPADEKRILALDSVDAVEVAHGKMGATTKLGFAVESMTQGKFADVFKKAFGLDDASFAKARDTALKASEWTTLGEMSAPSATLAFPGPLDGAGRSIIGRLPGEGARLAKELGLLDGEGLQALEQHLGFKGRESPAAQMLGAVRMLSALSNRRDFRTKESLSTADIHAELMKNAQPPEPKIDAKLVSLLQSVLDDAVKALRA